MLKLILPPTEANPVAANLHLEHSLVSLSAWEALYEKPFFGREDKSMGETYSYVRQMLLVDEPPDFEARLTTEHLLEVQSYINMPRTATTFRKMPNERPSSEVVTTDLVYYWLIQFHIPFQPTETWHFNRVMTLIKICGVKQAKPKKMSRQEQIAQMRELNEQRRKDLGSTG